jgi:hypothetical protein
MASTFKLFMDGVKFLEAGDLYSISGADSLC